MGDLKTGQVVRIREGGDPKYVDSGYLLFRLGDDIDVASVFAQRFDPERSALSGQPFPVLSDVLTPNGDATLSVTNRTIVFAHDTQIPNSFWWRSRSGEPSDTLAHKEYTWVYQVSHDGTRVAFAGQYLWVHDLVRRISERITTEVPFPIHFAWSQDDSRIVYISEQKRQELRVIQVTGTTHEDVIYRSEAGDMVSPAWSPDGRTILYVHPPNATRKHRELWAFDMEKNTASRLLKGAYNVFNTQFAPNGQWYAYSSDEGGGDSDVYLRSFPGPGAPIRVSAGGGVWPRWRTDGKELFYVNQEGRLVSVRIEFEGKPSVQRAVILSDDAVTANPYFRSVTPYDVHPNGQRFLLQQDWTMGDFSQLTILRDWLGMLEDRK